MEALLLDILETLRQTNADALEQEEREKVLAALLHKHNQGLKNNAQHHSKKRLLPFYLKTKDTDPKRWATWNIDADLEKRLLRMLQMKPRRTASGVATITVISKPWKCASNCLYCPNDVRMPKSYMTSEPACQRAERNFFDPYLQVTSRLRALSHMGHPADKIELIVLGGTMHFSQVHQNRRIIVPVVAVKMVVIPAIVLAITLLLPLSAPERFMILLTFAAPTASASYPMAENMGGDGPLAGQLVAFSSAISVVTLFLWVAGMGAAGLLA